MTNLAVIDKIEAVAGQPKSRFMLALAQSMPQGVGILPAALVRGALSAIKASESLQRCSEYSLFTSIAEVAQTGLSLDIHLGQAFLVPFSNQATVMYGYRGLCELARRSGEIEDIVGEIVYAKDEFHLTLGAHRDLIHVPFSGAPSKRGAMLGAYAIAEMRHGRSAFEYMTMEEIDRIKETVIKRKKSDKPSPWEMDGAVGEMIRKTPIRRLGKRLPQSPSLIPFVQASIRDEYRQAGVVQAVEMMPAVELALEQAEIVQEPENPPAKRESQIKEKPKAEQKAEDTGPISSDQFEQIYKLVTDLRLTVANDLLPIMRAMDHRGSPKQFPAAKFQELVARVMIRKTPIRRLGKRLPQSPSLIPFVQASIRDEYRQAGVVQAVEMMPAVELALEQAEIVQEPENPPAKRESQIKEKPKAEQKAEDTGPISSDQFEQIYKLVTDLRLTVANDLLPIMRAMDHRGSPKQFPAAKFQELVARVMIRKTPIRRLGKRLPQSPSLIPFVQEPENPPAKRESQIKEKPKAEQKAEDTGPISSDQFEQIYKLVTDLRLTVANDLLPIMRAMDHRGSPKQFPAAKFQELVARVMIRKTPIRRLGKRLPQSPSLIPFVQEPENPPAKRESQIKEKPKAEQKAEDTGPISSDQFEQIYKLVTDLRLTVANDLLPIMRAMDHRGSPKQFPAAKFQELVARVMATRK